jgi:hypothetical protein
MNPGDLSQGLWPWFALIVFGFLPSEVWRMIAVFLARGIDERSEWLVWIRAVATALLAGVVAKLLLSPNGALAIIPIWSRVGALVFGMAAFFLARRSLIAAILCAEAVIITTGYFVG